MDLGPALVYTAGSYRHSDGWERQQNVRRAEATARTVLKLGAYPVCPHCNTGPVLEDAAPAELFLQGTLKLMRKCDAVLLVLGDPNREASEGTKAEIRVALALGIPVFAHSEELATWLRKRQ